MLTSLITAQEGTSGLSTWQVLAIYLGLPAALFLCIALTVLLVAPGARETFPRLRPSSDAEAPEAAESPAEPSVDNAGAAAPSAPVPEPPAS